MIIDGNDAHDTDTFRTDVVIVGSGAAGIPLCAELARAGRSVILLESGGTRPTREANALSYGEVLDERHGPLHHFRQRVFGGTTSVWGGRCAPFDAIDFEARAWMPHSGWPVTVEALRPYYERAHDYLQLGSYQYDVRNAFLDSADPGLLSSENFESVDLWRFSNPVDLGRAWAREFRNDSRIKVLLNSTCVGLETDEAGTLVVRCVVRSISGQEFSVVGKETVLAAGGMETTRLLLTSRSTVHPDGLGNDYGLVGRYYSSHLAGHLGRFTKMQPIPSRHFRYRRTHDRVYARAAVHLREKSQRSELLPNFRATVATLPMSDPLHGSAVLSAAYLSKRFLLGRIPPEFDSRFGRTQGKRVRNAHIKNVITGVGELSAFAPSWLIKRTLSGRKLPSVEAKDSSTFALHFDAEQTPNWSSRVTLDERQTDAFGVPRLSVDWRVDDEDIATLARVHGLICYDLLSTGTARSLESSERFAERIPSELGVGSHHIGTTRMSTNERDGVVDKYGRVFGVKNLYIASSSVFPTPGVASPTLTITAQAIMVADRLAQPALL